MVTVNENHKENSRYKKSKEYEVNSTSYLPLLGKVVISIDDPLTIVSWSNGMELDLLSYQYYGTVKLWWVIAYANNIHDPFEPIEVGRKIYIPRRSAIPTKSL